MSTKVHSVTGVFNTPTEILHAAEEVQKAGYTMFDVNTPYPVHGIERAMKLKPSKLGYVTFFVGVGGALFAFLFMTWVSVYNYPLVIGGKPFFTWPAFIPITFEVTVLSASIATVLTMLFVMFRFPNISNPLHDTNYMKRVSSDKFGIMISSLDPKFDEVSVSEFLLKLGAKDIELIYYPENIKIKVFEPKFIIFLLLIGVITSGATYFILNKLMYVQPFSWMSEQNKVLPQTKSDFWPDGFSNRTPVPGTVSRNYIGYEFKGKPDSVIYGLSNPLPFNAKIVELGKQKYNTFCSPCHGYFGKGDSRLRNQFPTPPTLLSDRVKKWADGNIFHVITNGQNVMPSYAKQISVEDRWAIVHYIRVLQRAQDAKDTDLENTAK
ncbi:MAG: quinol:electron acceptor oxidoreductase subunit ActD [Ignavibacteria bacterium]